MALPSRNEHVLMPVGRDDEARNQEHKLRYIAPIALFVYNRPDHTQRTIESLKKNRLASDSDLFVFSDAARNEASRHSVAEVRSLIRSIDGFGSLTVIEREQNYGLAKSVIAGVTELCNRFGKAIVLEDDLLTASDFLTFMNEALNHYRDQPRVFSVTGFNFGIGEPNSYPYDAFFSYRSSSWGWGTWKDRWEKADWNVSDYLAFCRNRERKRLFNRGGGDLSGMLALQMAGKINSWAIRWAYTHFLQNALALLPVQSRVLNIGLDGSGVHCRKSSARQSALVLNPQSRFHFPATLEADPNLSSQVQNAHRAPLMREFARHVRQVGIEAWLSFKGEAALHSKAAPVSKISEASH